MKKFYLFLLLAFILGPLHAQVGINTNSPTSKLEVVGDVKMDGGLILENPGDNTQIRGSKFLIRSTANELLRYDIMASKYGPINYAEFAFTNLSPDGLLDYDTKISGTNYYVSLQGYSFGQAGSGRTGSIMPHSLNSNDNIEGYQFYAYINPATQTWWIRAFVNDSQFQIFNGTTYVNTEVDMFLNVMIYRKGFISKAQSDIAVDMGNLGTGTAPLPPGF